MFIDVENDLNKNFFLTMIYSARTGGKTYSTVNYAYKMISESFDGKNVNKKFFYIRRRYKNELEFAKNTLFSRFADIENNGRRFYLKRGNKKFLCGRCAALSELKSRGLEIEDLSLIIFDEFTIKQGETYLNNEFNIFASMLDTIVRLRENVQIIMLGNANMFYNPYTINLNIKRQDEYIDFNRSIYLKIYSAEITTERQTSCVAKLLAGTAYDEWASSVDFEEDHYLNIEKVSKNSKVVCTVEYNQFIFAFLVDNLEKKIFIKKVTKKHQNHYTFSLKNISDTVKLFSSYHPFFKFFRQMYTVGKVYFNNVETKSEFLDILNLIIST